MKSSAFMILSIMLVSLTPLAFADLENEKIPSRLDAIQAETARLIANIEATSDSINKKQLNLEVNDFGNYVTINGTTQFTKEPILLSTSFPNGTFKAFEPFISPNDDGTFYTELSISDWDANGNYTIVADQGPRKIVTPIDIRDGVVVPEFGTIAMMILGVAIFSVIAISAKSRLVTKEIFSKFRMFSIFHGSFSK